MTTQEKLNNVLGYLTAMSFDKPELSNDLVEPLNTLSEAISEVENLSLSDVVGRSEQLKAFSDYAQKRMWEDGDKDISEFVEEFLSL